MPQKHFKTRFSLEQVFKGYLRMDVSTCSVVRDPGVDDVDGLVRLCEVHLVGVGLEGLGQGPAVPLFQAHLSFHHHPTGDIDPLLTGQVPLQEALLPRHPAIYKSNTR